MPCLGHYKLTELRPEHFHKLYVALRKEKNMINGKPLSELTVEGVHACLCGILSDAVESGLLDHNPAWRTYKYSNIDKKQQVVADEEILQKLVCALEKESIKYETYFKLIIATGIRRGECCGIKWSDIDYAGRSIHICRNVVKVSSEDICIKEPKTKAGNRYVYFSPEMGTLLKEYRRYCETEALHYEGRTIAPCPNTRRADSLRFGNTTAGVQISGSNQVSFSIFLLLCLPFCQIFLQAQPFFIHLCGGLNANIPIMPYFLGNARDVGFISRVTEDKTVFVAVFLQPEIKIIGGSVDVHG